MLKNLDPLLNADILHALRSMGHNAEAAIYAGTSIRRMTMLAMGVSGALAGFVGVVAVGHGVILADGLVEPSACSTIRWIMCGKTMPWKGATDHQ